MQIQKLKTHKLFYNKWTRKIECRLPKIHYLARLGLDRTLDWLKGESKDDFLWRGADKKEIQQFVNAYLAFKDSEIQIRAEGSRFNIFLKDADLCDKIIDKLGKWITKITEPVSDAEHEFLLNNTSKKVICDKFPKGKYRYKIYMKERMNVGTREQFFNWMSRYGEKFNVAKSTTAWLAGKSNYMQNPFVYVVDEPTLSLTGMFLGDNLRKVEEFIPRNNINT